MYLPTSIEGMNAAIGQFIHGAIAEKIRIEAEETAARESAPGYVAEPYAWKKETVKPKFDLAVYCAEIRARRG